MVDRSHSLETQDGHCKIPQGFTTDSTEQKEGSGTSETSGALISKVGLPVGGGKKEKKSKRLIRHHEESHITEAPGGEERKGQDTS